MAGAKHGDRDACGEPRPLPLSALASRALYKEYFQEKQRGWTDEEFRAVCERIAGTPLAEIFDDYVYSAKDVDYRKYFDIAGLKIDTELRAQPGGPYLGAVFGNAGGRGAGGGGPAAPANNHVISRIEYDSPAARAGLSAQDERRMTTGSGRWRSYWDRSSSGVLKSNPRRTRPRWNRRSSKTG